MYESFIAREKSMPAREQVTFQPSLAHVLAQHFHHSSIAAHMHVVRKNPSHRNSVRNFKNCRQPILIRFIRPHHAEIRAVQIQLHYVAQELSEYPCRLVET